jgi:hypothetical protein
LILLPRNGRLWAGFEFVGGAGSSPVSSGAVLLLAFSAVADKAREPDMVEERETLGPESFITMTNE